MSASHGSHHTITFKPLKEKQQTSAALTSTPIPHRKRVGALDLVAVVHEDLLALHVGEGDQQHEEDQWGRDIEKVVLQAGEEAGERIRAAKAQKQSSEGRGSSVKIAGRRGMCGRK